MDAAGQTICLNMIVKDEAHVIRRCLASVRPWIDAWVIVDTGSTDGTQAIVREALRGVPGRLRERPWVGMAHNRTEALAAARGQGDYVLIIDADEVLRPDPGFAWPALSADSYFLRTEYGGAVYLRRQLLKDARGWRFEGVVHEYAVCDGDATEETLRGLTNVPTHDGARARDPLTYRKDAALLEAALAADPADTRSAFYLAQSWRDAGERDLAIDGYRRRAAMGGWAEEVWNALYQIAVLREDRGDPWPEVLADFLAAYQSDPRRAEPLFRVGLHCQRAGQWALARLFYRQGYALPPPPPECLFVETGVYTHLLAVEYAVVCYYAGDHAEALRVNRRLLADAPLSPAHRALVTRNLQYSLDALGLG